VCMWLLLLCVGLSIAKTRASKARFCFALDPNRRKCYIKGIAANLERFLRTARPFFRTKPFLQTPATLAGARKRLGRARRRPAHPAEAPENYVPRKSGLARHAVAVALSE